MSNQFYNLKLNASAVDHKCVLINLEGILMVDVSRENICKLVYMDTERDISFPFNSNLQQPQDIANKIQWAINSYSKSKKPKHQFTREQVSYLKDLIEQTKRYDKWIDDLSDPNLIKMSDGSFSKNKKKTEI